MSILRAFAVAFGMLAACGSADAGFTAPVGIVAKTGYNLASLIVTSGGPGTYAGSVDYSVRLTWPSAATPFENFCLLSATTPDGTMKMCIGTAGSIVPVERGVDAPIPGSIAHIIDGDEIEIRFLYDSGAAQYGLLAPSINGYRAQGGGNGFSVAFAADAPALNIPTAVTFNSDFGGSPAPYPITYFHSAGRPHVFDEEFMILGDSTTAISTTWTDTSTLIYTAGERWTRAGILSLAQGGGRISDEKFALSFEPSRTSPLVTAFIVNIGVNDLWDGHSSSTVIADIQDLVDTIHADQPTAVIFVGQIVPAGGFLSAGAQMTAWAAVNTAIATGGITGMTPITTYNATLNDGSDGIKPMYSAGAPHPNDAGRAVIAAAYRAALVAAGKL